MSRGATRDQGPSEPAAERSAHAPAGPAVAPAGSPGPLSLPRAIGNRATGRLLRDPERAERLARSLLAGRDRTAGAAIGTRVLQRDVTDTVAATPSPPAASTAPDWRPALATWLAANKIAPRDPDSEKAYTRNSVEPIPIQCSWNDKANYATGAAFAFEREVAARGLTPPHDDVLGAILDELSRQKLDRAGDIDFVHRDGPDTSTGGSAWFPWPVYDASADQFSDAQSKPGQRAAGPIVDWLDWHEFDAPWPAAKDGDACSLRIEGNTAAKVGDAVRLYNCDAIRAGFLGVDHAAVERFVRADLATRKQEKAAAASITDKPTQEQANEAAAHGTAYQTNPTIRHQHWDGRGIRDDRRAAAFGATPTVTPDPPPKDPGDIQLQYQLNFASHRTVKGGTTSTDPPSEQVTLAAVAFEIDAPLGGKLQLVFQGAATFNMPQGEGGLPKLVDVTLSNFQAAAQVDYAKDIVKDLLQVQAIVQAVGGMNTTPNPKGTLGFKAERMGQAVAGVQLAFTIPHTGKHVQIFVQEQGSITGTPGHDGVTWDQQHTVGVTWNF
jgi:hypothetical protein